ncbi:MAG: RNA-binding protein [Verrucomicrobia bacterium]|nr:RNA-binding protein [Verrucomicrobiota bacterium]
MNPNEWQPGSNLSRQPQPYYQALPPRPRVTETTLQEGLLQIERKSVMVALKENVRGRFVRITEGGSGRMNTVIIPVSGLKDFQQLVNEMAQAHDANPPAAPTQP